mmetsp:Transcript_21066/g.66134  ORF Transcript_21066/g.66134 Transcript_21066/m.66134 type:complete len:177 (+) Transcript_21066:20-550(+)
MAKLFCIIAIGVTSAAAFSPVAPLKAHMAASRASAVDMFFSTKAKPAKVATVAKLAPKSAAPKPAAKASRFAPKPAAPKPAAPKPTAPARGSPKPVVAKKTFVAPKSRAQPAAVRKPTTGSYAVAQRNRIGGGGASSITGLIGETVNTLLTPEQIRLIIGWAAFVFFIFTAFPAYE